MLHTDIQCEEFWADYGDAVDPHDLTEDGTPDLEECVDDFYYDDCGEDDDELARDQILERQEMEDFCQDDGFYDIGAADVL